MKTNWPDDLIERELFDRNPVPVADAVGAAERAQC